MPFRQSAIGLRDAMMADPVTALSVAKDFGVPLLSAVLGALLAYVPAARLAKKASDEMLARDREQRVETELTEARRAFVKLTLIANTLGSFHQDIEAMIARATSDGHDHMPLWQRLSTFAGIEDEPAVMFGANELAPFIAARRPELVDALLLLQRRHMAVVQSLRTFAKLKTELHYMGAQFGQTTRDETLVSTTRMQMPPEVAQVFRLKVDELDLFTNSMRAQVSDYADYGVETASLFNTVCEAYFGHGSLPALSSLETAT